MAIGHTGRTFVPKTPQILEDLIRLLTVPINFHMLYPSHFRHEQYCSLIDQCALAIEELQKTDDLPFDAPLSV